MIIKVHLTRFSSLIIIAMILFSSCSNDKKISSVNNNEIVEISEQLVVVPKDSLVLRPNEGLVYFYDKPFTGTSVIAINDLMIESIDYLEGKKHGLYKKWYESGVLSFEAHYKMGRQNVSSKT